MKTDWKRLLVRTGTATALVASILFAPALQAQADSWNWGLYAPAIQAVRSLQYALKQVDGKTLRLTVKNTGKRTATFTFRGPTHEVVIRTTKGKEVWRRSSVTTDPAVNKTLKIKAGEQLTFDTPIPDLDPGNYRAEAYLLGRSNFYRYQRAETTFEVKATKNLSFDLMVDQSKNPGKLSFRVANNTGKNLDLRFPGGQQYDFVLKNAAGNVVWRWSDGRMFTSTMSDLRLTPGAVLTYDENLPASLPAGTYTAEAWFMADGYASKSSAQRPVTIAGAVQPLSFDLNSRAEANATKLTFAVTNSSNRNLDLRFYTGQQYDFVLKNAAGNVVWRWSDGRMFTQMVGDLRLTSRAVLRFEESLPTNLPAGTYTAQAWLMAEGYSAQAVAQRSVTIAATAQPLAFALNSKVEANTAKLTFTVTNQANRNLDLRFLSGQQYDFTLKDRSGKVVWRWSDDQFFSQMMSDLRLTPGAVLLYEAAIPSHIPAGTYTAEAWFMAEGYGSQATSRQTVTLSASTQPGQLAYAVTPTYQSGKVKGFKVNVTNRSRSRISLKFPTFQHFEILLKNRSGGVAWRWSQGQVFMVAENMYDLEPGETREYTVDASNLPKGAYTLELYLPAESGTPVLTQTITLS